MVEKWELRAEPDSMDSRRHRLLIKADRKDIMDLIREFGPVFGRPVAVDDREGFNWSVPLRSLSSANKTSVSSFLESLVRAAPAGEVQAPLPANPALAQALAPDPVLEPVQEPAQESAPNPLPDIPLAPPPVADVPEPRILPVELVHEAAVAAPAPTKTLSAGWFGNPIDFDKNLDSLIVGPHNRFAHAAATSVVDAPASLYNPLFLFGPPGSGKTHVLEAVAAGLARSLGPDGIFTASGFQLSIFLDPSAARGPFPADPIAEKIKALLVDDVHLMQTTDANKSHLAKLFSSCLKNKRQIVVTSIYAPKALAFLEQALGISFGRGWAVDLKPPSDPVRAEIAKAYCRRRGLLLKPDDAVKTLLAPGADYAEFPRYFERLIAFGKMREAVSAPSTIAAMLPMLFESVQSAVPNAASLESARGFQAPPAGPDAPGLALFFPQGRESAGAWALARFHQAAAHYGFRSGYRQVLSHGYDSSQGVPFQMGRLCLGAGARAALVIGPGEDSSLSPRAAEFRHAVIHVLAAAGIRAAWVSHGEIANSAPFLNAHLDFLALTND
ncbi:MAG: DnaA ATPase domain-containing protein [Elusimicrobiota bacterium]